MSLERFIKQNTEVINAVGFVFLLTVVAFSTALGFRTFRI